MKSPPFLASRTALVRHGDDPVVAFVLGQRDQAADDAQTPADGFVGQPLGLERAVPQPCHVFEPVENLVGEIRSDLGDDHVHRIGPDIDDGNF